MDDPPPIQPRVGLCANCRHTREVVTGKGSRFFYCARSETDTRYVKYPRLPVVSCEGYQPRTPNPARE